MFKSIFIRVSLIVLIVVIGVLITLSRLDNGLNLFVILIIAFVIVCTMMILQGVYFYKFYTDDIKDQELRMKPCVNCEAPLYKTAEVCPYCKTKQ